MRTKRSHARGSILMDLLIASVPSMIVIALLIAAQWSALSAYERALSSNKTTLDAYKALREIRNLSQQAVQASVNGSGTQATIFLPLRDASGAIQLPVQPDTANPITLTVNFSTGTLTMTTNSTSRVLLVGIANRTPQGDAYSPFTLTQYAPGVQALHIRLSVQRTLRQGRANITSTAWFEETIWLRNASSP